MPDAVPMRFGPRRTRIIHRSPSGVSKTSGPDITALGETLAQPTLTLIGQSIPVTGSTTMQISLVNGNQALDRMSLESSDDNEATWDVIADTWSDFISLAGILTSTTGEMVTLAVGAQGIMQMSLTGPETHIRVRASVTDTTQTSGMTGTVTQS